MDISGFPRIKKSDLERLNRRSKFSDYLPWQIFDGDEQAFICSDNADGYIWECVPTAFASNDQIKALESLLRYNFPDGTVIQVISFADPNVDHILDDYLRRKTRDNDVSQMTAKRNAEHIKKGTRGMDKIKGVPVRNYRLFFTIKSTEPLDKNAIVTIEETLLTANLGPVRWNASDLMVFTRRLFNGFHTPAKPKYDRSLSLSKQIIDADQCVDFRDIPSDIGPHKAACLTFKGIGDSGEDGQNIATIDQLKANKMFGGYSGPIEDTTQITCPYLYTINIIIEDKTNSLKTNATVTGSQRIAGAVAKSLSRRVKENDWVLDKVAGNERFYNVIPVLWLFGDREDEKESQDLVASNQARVIRLWDNNAAIQAQRETFLSTSLFLSALPLGFYNVNNNIDVINRHFIWPADAIARFLPIQGDFRGSNNPVSIMIGRKGQIQGVDFFDKRANAHNFLVSAQTGAGKSFILNTILGDYYGAGAKLRLLDTGYSYKKLVQSHKGRFLDFGKECPCINSLDFEAPDEEDRDRALDMAIQVHGEMAYSMSGDSVSEIEWQLLKDACYWAYFKGHQEDGTKAVYNYLKDYPAMAEDKNVLPDIIDAAKRLAFLLKDFCGRYGQFFVGKNQFNIASDDFVVVELEKLKARPELFSVAIMQCMNLITSDMYLSDRKDPRFILFEEVASLLKKQGKKDLSRIGAVIDEGYRRARKYRGSVGVVLQALLDLQNFGEVGPVILSNAVFKLLLEGKGRYQAAVDEKIVNYSGLALELLESVTNNKPSYSEFFLDSPLGQGVGRLCVDKWQYWVATSDGAEAAMFEDLIKQGYNPLDALSKLSGIPV